VKPGEELILGIETSCDETSAALLRGESELLGHVILSQDIHRIYGGVVPELAARAHLQLLEPVLDEVLAEAGVGMEAVDAIAVTAGPGLVGALLVGVTWAKALAFARGIPCIGVHHLEGHLFAPSLEDPSATPPFVALLVSGGHTLLLWVPAWGEYHLLGETRDDAAGEAFDKVAKLLGLPYPGGPAVQKLAEGGDAARHPFPRPMLRRDQTPGEAEYFDFSFSGLKTAVAQRVDEVRRAGGLESELPHLAAGFQDAVVDVLVRKTMRAVRHTGCPRVLIGGGVSANGPLRTALRRALTGHRGGSLHVGSPRISLDNGAMIAYAGWQRLRAGEQEPLRFAATPRWPIESLPAI
jgi:N6-L-threonylcarbamoyladenine synthase